MKSGFAAAFVATALVATTAASSADATGDAPASASAKEVRPAPMMGAGIGDLLKMFLNSAD